MADPNENLGQLLRLLQEHGLLDRVQHVQVSGEARSVEFYQDAPVHTEVYVPPQDGRDTDPVDLAREYHETMYGAALDPDFPGLDG